MVEDGKQGKLRAGVIETTESHDPLGLLHPGKLRAWAAREAASSGAVGQTAIP
jgi:hypothetical protein